MKITCPDCSTSYEIKPEALGAEGRSVKCAKCGNRWFVSPRQEQTDEEAFAADAKPQGEDTSAPDEAPDERADEADWAAEAAEAEAREAAAEEARDGAGEGTGPDAGERKGRTAPPPNTPELADVTRFAADAAEDAVGNSGGDGPLDPAKADIETLAKRRKIIVNPDKFRRDKIGAVLDWLARRNFRRIGGVALLSGAVAMIAIFVLFRDGLVKQSPDLASLYQMVGLDVNLRGLEFRNLRTFTEIEDGKRVLVVEGSIKNLKQDTTSVPAVRLSIRSADEQEVYAWTVEPRTQALAGLDETRFRTILADPPTGASDLQVRFIDRGTRNIVLE